MGKTVRLEVRRRDAGLPEVRAAAFAMTGSAYVRLEGSRGGTLVLLKPKSRAAGAASGVKRAFESELAEQVRWWSLARASAKLRTAVARRALRPEPAGDAAPKRLSAAREAEIRRLLKEAEGFRDTLGIRSPWKEGRP